VVAVTDDLTIPRVDHDRAVHLAVARRVLGDVRDPQPVGAIRSGTGGPPDRRWGSLVGRAEWCPVDVAAWCPADHGRPSTRPHGSWRRGCLDRVATRRALAVPRRWHATGRGSCGSSRPVRGPGVDVHTARPRRAASRRNRSSTRRRLTRCCDQQLRVLGLLRRDDREHHCRGSTFSLDHKRLASNRPTTKRRHDDFRRQIRRKFLRGHQLRSAHHEPSDRKHQLLCRIPGRGSGTAQ
jgi:hypothetical protein